MAFGKDNQHLDNIPSFGQPTFEQQMAAPDQKKRSGGRGGIWWKNAFRLSDNPATPTRFRLLKGEYTQQYERDGQVLEGTFPYVLFREHTQKIGKQVKSANCAGGPLYMNKEHREHCIGCDKFWEEFSQRQADKASGGDGKRPRTMSLTDKYAFSVLDYGYFFEMPDVDDNGQIRTNRDGKPFTSWEKALNVHDQRYQGRRWKEGNVCAWPINKTWRSTLISQNVIIGAFCGTCTQGRIYTHGWYCGNPACRAFIFDPNNTSMTTEQQQTTSRNPFNCPSCGQHSFPFEHVSCSACQQGRRANIFDVDLYGFRQKNTDESKGTTLVISSFQITAPVFQTAEAAEVKTLDLLKLFAPTPNDIQQKIWVGAPPLYAPQGQMPMHPQQGHQQHYQQQPQWAAPPAPQGQGFYQPPMQQSVGHHPQMQPQQHYQPQPEYVDPNSLSAQLNGLNNRPF